MPMRVRQLRQCLVEDADVVGGGVRPGVAGAQPPGEELRVLSRNASMGCNPKVSLNVAAAASLSLWQMTIEALYRSPARAGRDRRRAPAGTARHAPSDCRAHTTSRARARAAPTAARAASSSWSSSRQHVESEATDPNNAAWSASTAMSEIVLRPPSATATARSTRIQPRSWWAHGRRSPPSAAGSSLVSVVCQPRRQAAATRHARPPRPRPSR